MLGQRLVVEMDGVLVFFFFEVGIANSCVSSDNEEKELAKGRADTKPAPAEETHLQLETRPAPLLSTVRLPHPLS